VPLAGWLQQGVVNQKLLVDSSHCPTYPQTAVKC
jgi:hypothetical protein